ncbi:imidazole glycerol phosphate synthase subunit HisF [Sporosarcina contaminans]|uniref:Imidazole glycerol phosphate synthase subunit HisF n=1 Tax=Sporosarcina contaminans TaxID=633403 RepID=A0ABW3U193_9BACL
MTVNRILPCLDIDNRKVVKGKNFLGVKEIADPLSLAKKYVANGADELVFYDISATVQNRGMFLDLIAEIAAEVPIPFIVGGGIRAVTDIEAALNAGADKVSINSAALKNPELIKEAAARFGSEQIILSMDVRRTGEGMWHVFAQAGMKESGLDAIEWAKEGARLGAGEIVVNSIDEDGVKEGYDLQLTKAIAEAVDIPVIASGGAGKMEHFQEAFTEGKAAGALAASVFHFNEINLNDLKTFLVNDSVADKVDV